VARLLEDLLGAEEVDLGAHRTIDEERKIA